MHKTHIHNAPNYREIECETGVKLVILLLLFLLLSTCTAHLFVGLLTCQCIVLFYCKLRITASSTSQIDKSAYRNYSNLWSVHMLNGENLLKRETCSEMHCNMVQQRRVHRVHMNVATLITHTSYTLHTCARLSKHIPNACSRNLHYSDPFCVVVFSVTSSIEKAFFARAHQCLQLQPATFFFFFIFVFSSFLPKNYESGIVRLVDANVLFCSFYFLSRKQSVLRIIYSSRIDRFVDLFLVRFHFSVLFGTQSNVQNHY